MSKLSKKKKEIKAELIQHGWKEDPWGHVRKTIEGRMYRIKFQKISIRKERKSGSSWININSGYVNKATIINAGSGIIDFGD